MAPMLRHSARERKHFLARDPHWNGVNVDGGARWLNNALGRAL
jgi:hypothetical protein